MTAPFSVFDPTSWPALAPYYLSQNILSGLSLITVNETNSPAPDTERRIVSEVSYGRQIGKLMDAVVELILEADRTKPAFADVLKLQKQIEAAKIEAKTERLKRLAADLADLKRQDASAFSMLIDSLKP